MAINTALLIAAPMLQDYFVDNATGEALSAGIITCYQDNSRTTLKNWYYQSGTPGAYTYITLPNPMTLSAVGTIVDGNGNDTIPFFYPFSENDNQTHQPYYITVDNSNGQRQFSRQNFPFVGTGTPSGNQLPTFENIIVNNRFWRNIGTLNAQNVTNQVIAPDQHDGFTNGDIRYIKNTTGATETITFTKFSLGSDPLTNDITPEFYINHDCTVLQLGETQKVYQFPISLHVETLDSIQASITIQAQNVGGSVNNTLSLYIYQFLGTGVTSPNPILIQQITLTNNWQKFVIPFTFPSAQGATLGAGGDDALFLQVGMPLSLTCNINFTLPSIYLSNEVPTNSFKNYDEINSIISSPRTGDARISMNSFYAFGWIPASNGTIGNAASSSASSTRANADTWPLFNLLWNYAKPYDSGSNFNPICQLYNSSTVAINYGGSAIADFNANNQLGITSLLGAALVGTVPLAAMIAGTYSQTITASNSAGNLLITPQSIGYFFVGQPITFTTTGSLPGNIVANAVYFVTNIVGAAFNVATSYANAIAGTPVVAFSSSGSNSSVLLDTTGIRIGEYSHTLTIAEMPSHFHQVPSTAVTNAAAGSGVNATSAGVSNTTSTGGSGAHNNVQPSVFMNVFLKL